MNEPKGHISSGCLILVGGFALVVVAAIVFLAIPRPTRASILERALPIVEPVSRALDVYYLRNGNYPETLDSLVAAQLLPRIPTLPYLPGVEDDPALRYEVSPDHAVCRLSFSCEIPEGPFGASVCFYYDSISRQWLNSKYPPELKDLIDKHHAKDRNG